MLNCIEIYIYIGITISKAVNRRRTDKYNWQKDKQWSTNTTQKIKDRAEPTPLIPGVNSEAAFETAVLNTSACTRDSFTITNAKNTTLEANFCSENVLLLLGGVGSWNENSRWRQLETFCKISNVFAHLSNS